MQPVSPGDLPDAVRFDAVVVPGGGIDPETARPRPWVMARLEAALALSDRTHYFIVLSQGTTHRAPPVSAESRPISESAASARYLIDAGVAPSRILLDTWSLDTIGNAFFARSMHADPLQLNCLAVVTSVFHMPRTKAIFDWVFRLDERDTQLFYVVTPDRGMTDAQAAARAEKEAAGVCTLTEKTIPACATMKQLAAFLFTAHGAYDAQHVADYRVAGLVSTTNEKERGNDEKLDNNALSTY